MQKYPKLKNKSTSMAEEHQTNQPLGLWIVLTMSTKTLLSISDWSCCFNISYIKYSYHISAYHTIPGIAQIGLLFTNLSEENVSKLQQFQNQTVKVLKKKKRDIINPLLRKSHWSLLGYYSLFWKYSHDRLIKLVSQDLVDVYTQSCSGRLSD